MESVTDVRAAYIQEESEKQRQECRGKYVATVMYGAERLEASASTRAWTREEMLRVGSMAALLSLSLRAKAKA